MWRSKKTLSNVHKQIPSYEVHVSLIKMTWCVGTFTWEYDGEDSKVTSVNTGTESENMDWIFDIV